MAQSHIANEVAASRTPWVTGPEKNSPQTQRLLEDFPDQLPEDPRARLCGIKDIFTELSVSRKAYIKAGNPASANGMLRAAHLLLM